jgi:hypothetical protein
MRSMDGYEGRGRPIDRAPDADRGPGARLAGSELSPAETSAGHSRLAPSDPDPNQPRSGGSRSRVRMRKSRTAGSSQSPIACE